MSSSYIKRQLVLWLCKSTGKKKRNNYQLSIICILTVEKTKQKLHCDQNSPF